MIIHADDAVVSCVWASSINQWRNITLQLILRYFFAIDRYYSPSELTIKDLSYYPQRPAILYYTWGTWL